MRSHRRLVVLVLVLLAVFVGTGVVWFWAAKLSADANLRYALRDPEMRAIERNMERIGMGNSEWGMGNERMSKEAR
jgi:hypothetical protein